MMLRQLRRLSRGRWGESHALMRSQGFVEMVVASSKWAFNAGRREVGDPSRSSPWTIFGAVTIT